MKRFTLGLLASVGVVLISGSLKVDHAAALDHFMCYKTKTSRGGVCTGGTNVGDACDAEDDCGGDDTTSFCSKNKFTGLQAALADGVNDRLFDVKRPQNLCAPANKNDEDPAAPEKPDHLEGYQLKLSKTDPPQEKLVGQSNIKVNNQLGALIVDLKKLDRLLVPTAKSLTSPIAAPTDPAVDHLACYTTAVKKNVCENEPAQRCKADADCGEGGVCNLGFPKDVRVEVQDQFQTRVYDLKKPTQLCRATEKTFPPNGTPETPDDPNAQLMWYQ